MFRRSEYKYIPEGKGKLPKLLDYTILGIRLVWTNIVPLISILITFFFNRLGLGIVKHWKCNLDWY